MSIFSALKRLIFPDRCMLCDRVLKTSETLCAECGKKLLTYPVPSDCKKCGLGLKDCVCSKRMFYSSMTSPFIYEGSARSALHRLKFRNRTDLIKPFAERMFIALMQRDKLNGIDVITYIPMLPSNEKKRGYNQAKLLAEELSSLSGIPVKPLLYRFMSADTQHSLGLYRRKGNILGAFEPCPGHIGDIENKRILVVDDIATTGATSSEAAKTLLIFGAEDVDCCVAAMAKLNNKKKKKP